MGTEVHYKSYLPGYYSMRDPNEDANSSSWSLYYGERNFTNVQHYNGVVPRRTVTDAAYPEFDKDALKQKMLEHDAIFKNQVYELHRLYRIQMDMMEEVKKKEYSKRWTSTETSSGSSLIGSKIPSEDAWKMHYPRLPVANSGYSNPSVLNANIISPLSCTKGNGPQAVRGPYQNGYIPKGCELLESKPSKIRKKLFGFQLPADEYIDTEEVEQIRENKISDISSHAQNPTPEKACANELKFFLGGSSGTKYRGNASTSDSCVRSSIGLDNLNGTIRTEEVVPTCVDFLGHSASHGGIGSLDLSAKRTSEFLSLPKEHLRNSYQGSNHQTLNNASVQNKGNGIGWSSDIYEAGKNKSSLTSIPQDLPQNKLPVSSRPTQEMHNNGRQPLGVLPTDHSREGLWNDRLVRDSDFFDRYHDYNSLDPMNSRSNCASAWAKPISSLTQNLSSVHTLPFLNSYTTLGRSSQSSAQRHEISGDQWHVNGSYLSNPGPQSERTTRNGFHPGSSSGSKEISACFPSVRLSYQNSNVDETLASEHPVTNCSEKFFKCSNLMDVKFAKDMNLNVVLPSSSFNEVGCLQDFEIDETRKGDNHRGVLPWLKGKPATDTRTDSISMNLASFQASSNPFSSRSDAARDLNQLFSENALTALTDCDIDAKKETSNCLTNRKFLGLPIFECPGASKNEPSSLVSTSASLHCPPQDGLIRNDKKNRMVDINLACDPLLLESGKQKGTVVAKMAMDTKNNSFRSDIDLNSCMTEDEDLLAPSVGSTNVSMKVAVDIDLEAPAIPETEEDIQHEGQQKQYRGPLQFPEHKAGQPQNEVVWMAAEAIVAISSSSLHSHKGDSVGHLSETCLTESLLWFVEAVSFCADDLENKFGKERRSRDNGDVKDFSADEIDEFEAMALQLTETKEEDYMPKPFVPEIQKEEESGAMSSRNRPRKCQARRGRQRRDFQRDILPGIVTLSRHEVTEDLQTFDGLMKASGYSWDSGLMRRNGARNRAARGRRQLAIDAIPSATISPVRSPLISQVNSVETRLEDISLTGWGKRTRRPRRQRCPAGNPSPATLI